MFRFATRQWKEHVLHEDGGFSECDQFDTEMCSHCAALPSIIEFSCYLRTVEKKNKLWFLLATGQHC